MGRKDYIEKELETSQISDSNAEVAFWIYYQLGERRSLNKVSKKAGIPLSKIQEWSRTKNWSQRVKDLDEMANDSQAAKRMASLAKIAQLKTFALW